MIEPHNDIIRFIDHTVDEIKTYFLTITDHEFSEYDFGYGKIYIVYERKIRFIASRLTSYEIEENGIILEQNNDYLYYNFKENYEKKEEIIEEFVEKKLSR